MSETAENATIKTVEEQARKLAGENGRTMLSLIDTHEPLTLPVDVEKALLNPSNPDSLIIDSAGLVEHPPKHKTTSGEWYWRLGQVIGVVELRTKKDGRDNDPEVIFWNCIGGHSLALNLRSGEIFYVPKYYPPQEQQSTSRTTGYLESPPAAEEFKGFLLNVLNSPEEGVFPKKIPPDWLEKESEVIEAEKPEKRRSALQILSGFTENLNVPREKFEGGAVDLVTRQKLLDFLSQNQEHLVPQLALRSS